MWIRWLLSGCVCVMLFSGCQQQEGRSARVEQTPMKVTNEQKEEKKEIGTIRTVRDLILPMKQVRKMKVGAYDKDIIVVLELKHLYTFQSESIIKKVKDKIKKQFPKQTVKVTTDHKIYIELEKLEKKIEDDTLSEKELEKEMKDIKKLLKET